MTSNHVRPVTKSDLWPSQTCDQVWPVTRCDLWPVVTSDHTCHNILSLICFNKLFCVTRCNQWTGVTSDQVWPVARCDQWPDVTSCQVILLLPATSSLLWPAASYLVTSGHKPYPSGPKLDQHLSPHEVFRSLGPKVKEELRFKKHVSPFFWCGILPLIITLEITNNSKTGSNLLLSLEPFAHFIHGTHK